jgi:hypothetical protein
VIRQVFAKLREMLHMMNADVARGLSGFLEWSDPVIFDRLLGAYRDRLGTGARPWELARLHSRVWRALIAGDMPKYNALRVNLAEALYNCRLEMSDVADTDTDILVELLDVVMTRYQRSMRTAKNYHLALIALAGRLAPPLRVA